MYHGSKTLIKDFLEPRISFELEKFVYGTDDYYYALVRSGNFDITKFRVREEYEGKDHKFQLVECYHGAFEELFDRKGYIYELDDADFYKNDEHLNEYLSRNPVKIVNTIEISNIWEAIIAASEHYELIRHEDSEEFWKTVKGGKEGYLKRKEESVARILNARK